MTPGFWMVVVVRGGAEVPARIWVCDHEPGRPENKVDQPYTQGQLGTELHDPLKIWDMVWFCELSEAERQRIANPPQTSRQPKDGRKPALTTAPLALWKQLRARRIDEAEWRYQVADLQHAQAYRPEEPKNEARKPVDFNQAPLPF